jgi:SdrD B-like domain
VGAALSIQTPEVPPASIGDYVWVDENENGIQDAGEAGLPGVTVYLFECGNMDPIDDTTTDANGYYLFDNLVPGDYQIMFVKLAGYKFSPQNAGANDALDSDALPTSGMTECTTLDAGEHDMTWDAGMYQPEEVLSCRMTGGANGEALETIPDRVGNSPHMNVYSCGGQAGASLAGQPQPWGEWTHSQERGPAGSFTFHGGTASAPQGTEIDWIQCSDPGWCVHARSAPAKQLDFAGVGTFHSLKNVPPSIGNYVTVGESLHWFEVNIDDLGEPGKAGKQPPAGEMCDPLGFGRNGGPELADCDCPDFYRIRIYAGPTDASIVIYEAHGYIEGGNFQIHPPTGRDRVDLDSGNGKGHGK